MELKLHFLETHFSLNSMVIIFQFIEIYGYIIVLNNVI